MNLPQPAKFAEGLRTPQQLLRSWYIFLFQLPVLPELLIQLGDYQAISEIPNYLDTVNVHNYDTDISNYTRKVGGWMKGTVRAPSQLWENGEVMKLATTIYL